jgi:hypothetical protein
MRILLFLSVSLFATSSFSSVELYQVDVKSSYADGKASRAKLVLREGEAVSYTDSHQNTIEVVATEHEIGEGQNIQLDFAISREDADGTIILLSAPKIVTAQNRKSEIETTMDNGDKVSLIVKAKRL